MTTRKKPPTLAALRKMAKRKGQELIFDRGGIIKVCEQMTWWLKVVYGPLNILTGGTIIRDRAAAMTCVFAALSSLPDAPKARKAR